MGSPRPIPMSSLWTSGCKRTTAHDPFSMTVFDESHNHKLALVYRAIGRGPEPKSTAFEFESLVWLSKDGLNWTNRAVITKADFNDGSFEERWISEIHSVNPGSATAIIKVAQLPKSQDPDRRVTYSWREWDLISNREVRVLKICNDPFEPLTGRRIKLHL